MNYLFIRKPSITKMLGDFKFKLLDCEKLSIITLGEQVETSNKKYWLQVPQVLLVTISVNL